MPELLVIIPTYNEIQNLESIVGRIRAAVSQADILVVDDASPDGTGELADSLAALDPRISVLHRAQKQGLGQAYLAGFAQAISAEYDFVAEIDSDGSHDPAELPAMLAMAIERADLVIGSRWVRGGSVRNWPWIREAVSRTGNAYARVILRSSVKDITAGYRVFRTSALKALELGAVSSQGYCFQVEIAWQLERRGSVIVEHPITFVERANGRSKMHIGIVAEALWRVTLWGVAQALRGRPKLAVRAS